MNVLELYSGIGGMHMALKGILKYIIKFNRKNWTPVLF